MLFGRLGAAQNKRSYPLDQYFFADTANRPQGPVTRGQLEELLANGSIHQQTQVILQGDTVWKPYWVMFNLPQPQASAPLPMSTPPLSSTPPNLAPRPPVVQPTTGANAYPPERKVVTTGTAILWFFLCTPMGFNQWGQGGKGLVWILISLATGGIGGIVSIIDYWMCYSAQQKRDLGAWEFFPK